MVELEMAAFAFGTLSSLLATAITKGVSYSTIPFLRRRKVTNQIDDAIADSEDQLIRSFEAEGLSEAHQRLLLQTCADELRPVAENYQELFSGSLNGQKIFEDMYATRDFPETINTRELRDAYALLCPRVATLLATMPSAIKDWEVQAWAENYKRLDNVVERLGAIYTRVNEMASGSDRRADETLIRVRRDMAQRVEMLDLTGLRGDEPQSGRLQDLFVHPTIAR